MLKIGNLRIGKGIALILRKRLMVLGGGTQSFVAAVAAEVGGINTNRALSPKRLRDLGLDEDWYEEAWP